MKKSDLILAQKTLKARQVKLESQFLKEELQSMRESYNTSSSTRSLSSRQSGYFGNSLESPTYQDGSFTPLSGSRNIQSLPEIRSPSASSSQRPSTQSQRSNVNYDAVSLSQSNEDLVNTLSQRSLTDKTSVRKKQVVVRKALMEGEMGGNSMRPNTTMSNTGSRNGFDGNNLGSSGKLDTVQEIPEIDMNDNYFMPKKKILRPDGATLLDIYESKKGDTWGKIIRAQYLEDEDRKKEKKKAQERANEEYGRLLKEQVDGIHQRKMQETQSNDKFADLEHATAKRNEDLQKRRDADAIARHKQFISNAIEDIGIKHHQHEQYLKDELTASTVMVTNAKKWIQQDELKKQKEKEYHKTFQDILYQENLDNIARKQKVKLDSFAEDKRIFAEQERQRQRDKKRHDEEMNERMKRSSEGPAHHIVMKITKAKIRNDDDFYVGIMKQDNNLNKQLKESEDAARARAEQNGQSLTDEWVKNTLIKTKKKQDEEERNNKIISTMQAMLKQQEEEDRAKRELQKLSQRKYQEDLDGQVNALRQRSIDTLKKTMSVEEAKYNSDLIKKTSAYVK